jgi:uncharacterized protein YcbK (DUF882 family)
MGDISKHFSRIEFACKCKDQCGFDTVDVELIAILEDVREHFGASISINSGCRCAKHNKAVGGEANSLHMIGRAADFTVAGPSPAKVYQYLVGKYPEQYGMGLYRQWCHIDSRKIKARWDKS